MAVLCVHIKPHCLQAVWNLDNGMVHVQMCNRSEVGGHSRHKLCSTRNKGQNNSTLIIVACSHALTLANKSMPACGQLLDLPWQPRL